MRLTRPGADHTPSGARRRTASANVGGDRRAGHRRAHLPQPRGHPLRRYVVDPSADAGLGAGEVLQLARRAQHRHDLQVQPRDVAALAHRRLVPAGDVGQRDRLAGRVDVVAVEPLQQVQVDLGQLVALGVLEGDQVGHVAVRREVDLDRPAGGVRDVGGPVPPGEDHARAVAALGLQDVGAEQPAGAVVVRAGLRQQLAGARRDVRVGVDLPVRVVQGHPDLLAAVLEAEDLLHLVDRGQRSGAVRPRVDDGACPGGAERGERRAVVAGEADDLAPAVGRALGQQRLAGRRSRCPATDGERAGSGSRRPRRRSRWPGSRRARCRGRWGTAGTRRPAAGRCG